MNPRTHKKKIIHHDQVHLIQEVLKSGINFEKGGRSKGKGNCNQDILHKEK